MCARADRLVVVYKGEIETRKAKDLSVEPAFPVKGARDAAGAADGSLVRRAKPRRGRLRRRFWGKSLQPHPRRANLSRWRSNRAPEAGHLGKTG